MIRLSRMGATVRSGIYLASMALGAFGCAQNGSGNGGSGGAPATAGAGGIAGAGGETGEGGGSGGAAGASGSTGGVGADAGGAAIPCPQTPTPFGRTCTIESTPVCLYNPVSCCGTSYPTLKAYCNGFVTWQDQLQTPCFGGGVCPSDGGGGQPDGAPK